jgi:hypothetical protein
MVTLDDELLMCINHLRGLFTSWDLWEIFVCVKAGASGSFNLKQPGSLSLRAASDLVALCDGAVFGGAKPCEKLYLP